MFEALKEYFHSYENAYFENEPGDTELAATKSLFEDLTEKFYEIGGRVDDLFDLFLQNQHLLRGPAVCLGLFSIHHA